MTENDSLRQALGALERHAPAEIDVYTGVREGISRRRRRRQVTSVLGVAGVASAVALGVVFATVPGDDAGSPTGLTPASPSTATPPPTPALPFTAGWIPAGYTVDAWEVTDDSGSAQYVGTNDYQAVVVWVSEQPRDPAPEAVDEPATIAGRPGTLRTLGPGQTQLIWQLPDNRWAMVGGTQPAVPLAALHQVAANLTGTPTPLDVDLSLTSVPTGYQVTGWANGSPTLCGPTPATPTDSRPDDCVTVSLVAGTAPATVPGPLVVTAEEKENLEPVDVPVDQEETVNGVLTRATADGLLAIAQVDPGHWVKAFSQEAGVDILRETVTLVEAG